MSKFLSKFFIVVLFILATAIIFLTYFGLETDRFDSLIKSKSNEVNEYVKLEFKKTKIHLNIKDLNFAVKLQNPKILVKKNEIILSKLDLFLPLKSFFTSDFLLTRSEIAFAKNDIKDLTKITNIFFPRIINKRLNKIFSKGEIEGEFLIPFNKDGSIGKGYGFSGKISNSTIYLNKEFYLKKLTTEIRHTKESEHDIFEIIIKKGSLYDLELADTKISLKRDKSKTGIKSILHTNGKINFEQFKKITTLLNLNLDNLIDLKGIINLETSIDLDLRKGFKFKNLTYLIEGNLNNLEIQTKDKKIIKKFFPDYNSKIIFKDTNVKINKSSFAQVAELDGLIKLNNKFDAFKISEEYNIKKNIFYVNGLINTTNSKIILPALNFIKESNIKSEINLNVNFALNKYYNIKRFILSSENNKVDLSEIKLNKDFEIIDLSKIEVKTFINEIKNNDFLIKKTNNINIKGEVFDAHPIFKSLYRKSSKKTFSKNFNSKIKINFDKVFTGTNDDVSDFSLIATMNSGSYDKLSLKGNFSKNEIVEMSIYQVDKDKKTLQVISDRARPFVKNFDFIKGFEGGKLDYESTITKEETKSNLLITDFKVSKVPALAKLLTLASLQGIADTLKGEGIRFESFEMKSNSSGNVLNIEDALAMGPAVSILLDGYVDKGKTVSLRGTLVPATKLNAIVASIPLIGDILVGKKTGEGVVGVSFKMKGPPKDIRTTVNPIKTLTPRFIVRAIEKMKKKKKKEVK